MAGPASQRVMLRAALLAARLQPAMMAPGISPEDVYMVSWHPTCCGTRTAADSVGRCRLNAERSHYKSQQVAIEGEEAALCGLYSVCMCVTHMHVVLPACLPAWLVGLLQVLHARKTQVSRQPRRSLPALAQPLKTPVKQTAAKASQDPLACLWLPYAPTRGNGLSSEMIVPNVSVAHRLTPGVLAERHYALHPWCSTCGGSYYLT